MTAKKQDKQPPQSLEAERAALGAMLIDPEALDSALERLGEDSFFLRKHSVIFGAMKKMVADGAPVDYLTLANYLKESGKLEKVGGSSYLLELVSSTITSAHIEQYATMVQDRAILRGLISVASGIIEDCYSGEKPTEQILEEAEQRFFMIRERRLSGDFTAIGDFLNGVYQQIESIHKGDDTGTSVKTGFSDLDEMTTGFSPSDYIIVAGRTSAGKTAFALSLAREIAIRGGKGVGCFSVEMSREQLVTRLIAAEAGVNSHHLRSGRVSSSDLRKVAGMLPRLAKAPIFIDDSASIDVLQMRTKARRLMRKADIGLFIVDYLQLIRPAFHSDSREREIAQISAHLKGMARELKVPVMALSQLSRQTERRQSGKGRPRLSDLRESGAIEQDADIVMFVYRPEQYRVKTVRAKVGGQIKEIPAKGVAEIILAKQRNGPTGSVFMRFQKGTTSFELLTLDEYAGDSFPAGDNDDALSFEPDEMEGDQQWGGT